MRIHCKLAFAAAPPMLYPVPGCSMCGPPRVIRGFPLPCPSLTLGRAVPASMEVLQALCKQRAALIILSWRANLTILLKSQACLQMFEWFCSACGVHARASQESIDRGIKRTGDHLSCMRSCRDILANATQSPSTQPGEFAGLSGGSSSVQDTFDASGRHGESGGRLQAGR